MDELTRFTTRRLQDPDYPHGPTLTPAELQALQAAIHEGFEVLYEPFVDGLVLGHEMWTVTSHPGLNSFTSRSLETALYKARAYVDGL